MTFYSEGFNYADYTAFLAGGWSELSTSDDAVVDFPGSAELRTTFPAGSNGGFGWTHLLPSKWHADAATPTIASSVINFELNPILASNGMGVSLSIFAADFSTGATIEVLGADPQPLHFPSIYVFNVSAFGTGGMVNETYQELTGIPRSMVLSWDVTTGFVFYTFKDISGTTIGSHVSDTAILALDAVMDTILLSVAGSPLTSPETDLTVDSLAVSYAGGSPGPTYRTPNITGSYKSSATTFTKSK